MKLILAFLALASSAYAQERIPWPSDMGCVTVNMALQNMAEFFRTVPVPGTAAVHTDPTTGDVTMTTTALGVATSFNHLFRNGCLFETWEEPLAAPARRGVPA